MPLIIFWLTPVLLLVIFLVVISQNKVSDKPKVFLVEPLLFLVKKWELARIEGDEKKTKRLLSYWLPGLEMQQSIIEQLTRQINVRPPIIPDKSIIILNQKTLPFWAEERELDLRGKKTSVLAGPISELIKYCDSDTKGPLSREQTEAWLKKIDNVYANGFLAVAFAESSSKEALNTRKYRLIGVTILEPGINTKNQQKIRQMSSIGKIKIISFLPAALAEHIMQKVFPSRKDAVISGLQLSKLTPKKQEEAMDSSTIFGEIDAKNRYYIARHFHRDNDVTVVSNVSSDSELPADNRI